MQKETFCRAWLYVVLCPLAGFVLWAAFTVLPELRTVFLMLIGAFAFIAALGTSLYVIETLINE